MSHPYYFDTSLQKWRCGTTEDECEDGATRSADETVRVEYKEPVRVSSSCVPTHRDARDRSRNENGLDENGDTKREIKRKCDCEDGDGKRSCRSDDRENKSECEASRSPENAVVLLGEGVGEENQTRWGPCSNQYGSVNYRQIVYVQRRTTSMVCCFDGDCVRSTCRFRHRRQTGAIEIYYWLCTFDTRSDCLPTHLHCRGTVAAMTRLEQICRASARVMGHSPKGIRFIQIAGMGMGHELMLMTRREVERRRVAMRHECHQYIERKRAIHDAAVATWNRTRDACASKRLAELLTKQHAYADDEKTAEHDRRVSLRRAATIGRVKRIDVIPHAMSLVNVLVECLLLSEPPFLSTLSSSSSSSPSSISLRSTSSLSSSTSVAKQLSVVAKQLPVVVKQLPITQELAFLTAHNIWKPGDLALVFTSDRDFYMPTFPETQHLRHRNLVRAQNTVHTTIRERKLRKKKDDGSGSSSSSSDEKKKKATTVPDTYYSAGLLSPLTWVTENFSMFIDLGADASPYLDHLQNQIIECTQLLPPLIELVYTYLNYTKLTFGTDLTDFLGLRLKPPLPVPVMTSCTCTLCHTPPPAPPPIVKWKLAA
jgi:hypothetical protein